MKDGNCIATLKDYQVSIDTSFKRIDKNLRDFDILDNSFQKKTMGLMQKELNNIKNNLELMEQESANLKDEENIDVWENTKNQNSKKYKEYKKKIERKKENQKTQDLMDDYDDIDAKVDHNKMTTEQAFKRGDKILDQDDHALDRMVRQVDSDKNQMKIVNQELEKQKEQLENADKDLKEIDYSLQRAGKQMRQILKMYATDKIIMCIIIVLLLVIVTIIIVGCLKGKKGNENKKNSGQKDIFS